MEFKHTPGPWKVGRNEVYRPASTVSISPYYKQICSYVTSGPESIANANLIASAQELLEALIHFKKTDITNYNDVLKALEKADAAITKATGGQI